MIILKCEGHPAVTNNYVLIPKAKIVMISNDYIPLVELNVLNLI